TMYLYSISIYNIKFHLQCGKKSYNVIFEQFTIRSVSENSIVDGSNLHLMGRERLINGTVILKEDVGDDYKVNINFYTDAAGTGDWRILPYSISDASPCEALIEYGQYTEPSLQQGVNTNAPVKGDVCPIPKGEYFFRDIAILTDDWPTQMPRGPAKGILTMSKDGELLVEVEAYVRIENSYM
ncbi:hypothetical protein KR222_000642, partial [Zaprionus bogoriensis]